MLCLTLESAHAAVCDLIADFSANEAHYLAPNYSEAQARISFIDKLWQALGWDVTHQQQKNPYAQEVKVEDPQKIQGANRRADYAFHTAPNFRDARFFCEAKKPHVQLRADADAAFQTLRYGWNAGTPLAVLTDFEQTHIFDCRAKPDIETALARSHRFFHYKDWLNQEKFAEFYYLFSREAFRDGGFDAYISKLPRPKKVGKQLGLLRTGTQPVDAAFLLDLEEYRETLAKLLKSADHSLDGDALTELVQRILDRLVFLRFLEDKLIETEIQVQQFSRAAGGHSWAKFLAASRKLDARYNGIVFKHHPVLDTAGRLPVDDARFSDLCEDLSHTKSPYDFNAIPIHILGSIYERFLGKVITTTAHQAKVVEKPEVRKAGGVYYTPEYIVRYICEQTVGKLIEGKTPAQIAKLRFADIACGSGSFLLGIYDLLLRTHGLWYNAHPAEAVKENLAPPDKSKKRKKEFIPTVVERDGVLRLTLEKKRDILLNNVFGVDLDPQAVEVAQLSLYLKLLEDETTASAHQHYLDFAEALLPSLNKNVIRGNSLIGTDILFGQFEFSAKEERKLAPMDFESAFPNVMKEGGFDAIVGNPPWGADLKPASLKYLSAAHARVVQRMVDSYIYFTDQAVNKVCESGSVGYVIPSTVLNQVDTKPLRKMLLDRGLDLVVNMGKDIFTKKVLNTTTLIVTSPKQRGEKHPMIVGDLTPLDLEDREDALVKIPAIEASGWNASVSADSNLTFFTNLGASTNLLLRLQKCFQPFASYTVNGISRGVSPDIAEAHVLADGDKELSSIEKSVLRRSVSGKKIKRYADPNPDQWLVYTDRRMDPRKIPGTVEHLSHFRSQNTCKEVIDGKHPWWALHRARDAAIFNAPKFIGLTTTKKFEVIIDEAAGLYVTDAMYVFRIRDGIPHKVVLGIIHSRLFLFLYRISNQGESRVIPQIKAAKLGPLPVPDLTDSKHKSQHYRMVQLVDARHPKTTSRRRKRHRPHLLPKQSRRPRPPDRRIGF